MNCGHVTNSDVLLMHFFSEKPQHTVMLAVAIDYHGNLLMCWVDILNECGNTFKIKVG